MLYIVWVPFVYQPGYEEKYAFWYLLPFSSFQKCVGWQGMGFRQTSSPLSPHTGLPVHGHEKETKKKSGIRPLHHQNSTGSCDGELTEQLTPHFTEPECGRKIKRERERGEWKMKKWPYKQTNNNNKKNHFKSLQFKRKQYPPSPDVFSDSNHLSGPHLVLKEVIIAIFIC